MVACAAAACEQVIAIVEGMLVDARGGYSYFDVFGEKSGQLLHFRQPRELALLGGKGSRFGQAIQPVFDHDPRTGEGRPPSEISDGSDRHQERQAPARLHVFPPEVTQSATHE